MRAAVVCLGDLGRSARMRYHAQALAAQLGYLAPDGQVDWPRLAEYVKRCASALDAQPAEQILAGRITWPDPAAT